MKKYTIKDVSERLNLSQHTIRYYEKIGVIEISRNDSTNKREFTEKDIEWLEYIIALKKIGFTLEDIRSYTLLKKNDRVTLAERKSLLQKQLGKISEQIDFLNQVKSIIEEKISCIEKREKNYED